ncbi:unnamed protein product [Trichogramma brassicae]|uniref:Uncharacterized protein n=1 Tax=Trichogramma brassicae TaxID=86971 RepID=A0A6H5HYR5_9HYME|nr:unnamed protein product [Trichogramma brassicae]
MVARARATARNVYQAFPSAWIFALRQPRAYKERRLEYQSYVFCNNTQNSLRARKVKTKITKDNHSLLTKKKIKNDDLESTNGRRQREETQHAEPRAILARGSLDGTHIASCCCGCKHTSRSFGRSVGDRSTGIFYFSAGAASRLCARNQLIASCSSSSCELQSRDGVRAWRKARDCCPMLHHDLPSLCTSLCFIGDDKTYETAGDPPQQGHCSAKHRVHAANVLRCSKIDVVQGACARSLRLAGIYL